MACENNCLNSAQYLEAEKKRAQAVLTAATIRQVAAVAIALDNATQLIEVHRRQNRIADRAMRLAESERNHVATTYWPREIQFLNEFANPEPQEEVEVLARRYSGRLVAQVAGTFAPRIKEARCSMQRYCLGANRKLVQDLMLMRANAMANARALGRNIAFAEYQARHDRDSQRRLQAIAIGNGLMGAAATLYRAAGEGLANASNSYMANFQSAMQAFGVARQEGRQARNTYDSFVASKPSDQSDFQSRFAPGGTYSRFSLESTWQETPVSTGAEGLRDLRPFTENYPMQQESLNQGAVGNNDLAHKGEKTYNVVGNTVTVKMSDFPLTYVDHLTQGQTT